MKPKGKIKIKNKKDCCISGINLVCKSLSIRSSLGWLISMAINNFSKFIK